MKSIRIILDTTVLYAGLYSADGASHQVLRAMERGQVQIVVSTTLLFEYEDILTRKQAELGLSDQQIEAILDNLCQLSDHQNVYYLWRPWLPDPKDDHILEVAVASRTSRIVTHNLKDFKGIEQTFGIRAIPPKALLEELS
ncbi:PilT protein domain protein [Candidatus Vecturithrix granuli]|uniref:PilT protein domain protein n=1 Tax=Vecturithrix granuli TaxID=1499967 RepID=A0A081C6M5_VECG1|nr:PilT protein domain protein [Candidatus Vecturithrix granuli]